MSVAGLGFDYSTPNTIYAPPSTAITFSNGASFSWGTGKLVFEGPLDETALIFFNYLKSYIDSYIKANAPYGNLEYLEYLYDKKVGKKETK